MMGQGNGGFSKTGLDRVREVLAGHVESGKIPGLVDKIDRLPPSYAPDPPTGQFVVWDEAADGQYSQPLAFQSGGSGLVTTVDDYHAYFRMLLNDGMHGSERILSRPAVALMTTNRLTPEQQAARTAMARDNVHLSHGQGQHGGWGFGMAVRTYRGDYASVGQFGWDGGTGTSAYADPTKHGPSTTSGPRSTRQSTTDKRSGRPVHRGADPHGLHQGPSQPIACSRNDVRRAS